MRQAMPPAQAPTPANFTRLRYRRIINLEIKDSEQAFREIIKLVITN